jgi:hypothetical protein
MISGTFSALALPFVNRFPVITLALPPMETRLIIFDSPGSNRTDVPAGMFKRIPILASRSNLSALFVSTNA